jgi:invasion protein IalB
MSTVTTDRQLVDQSTHTRWAWVGVLLAPVGVLLALGVGVLIGNTWWRRRSACGTE